MTSSGKSSHVWIPLAVAALAVVVFLNSLGNDFVWDDDVPEEVKRERNRRLLKVQERHSLAMNQRKIGRSFEVLVEGPSRTEATRLTGRTRANQIVVFPGDATLAGRLVEVVVQRVTPLTLIGKLGGTP